MEIQIDICKEYLTVVTKSAFHFIMYNIAPQCTISNSIHHIDRHKNFLVSLRYTHRHADHHTLLLLWMMAHTHTVNKCDNPYCHKYALHQLHFNPIEFNTVQYIVYSVLIPNSSRYTVVQCSVRTFCQNTLTPIILRKEFHHNLQ